RQREAAAAAQPRRRRGGRLGRVLLVLALLLGLGAIAGIVIADQSGVEPRLRDVTAQDARDAIQEVKDFIAENTR
ncbi:MAG TPA: hypothetical protein VNB64_01005, partial [Solirubrobacteraceae bacterium]|nr:hypothetical protein [Solirubrobacteraceae bacterium]